MDVVVGFFSSVTGEIESSIRPKCWAGEKTQVVKGTGTKRHTRSLKAAGLALTSLMAYTMLSHPRPPTSSPLLKHLEDIHANVRP